MPTTPVTLLICHSMGDTNAILKAAQALPLETNIHILTLGSAAKNMLSNTRLSSNISLAHADDILSGQFSNYEDGAFTDAQLQILQDHFQSLKIDRVLIGTPSKAQATTYLQIAKYFSNNHAVVYKAILNDYLFEDTGHSYWLQLQLLAEAPTELLWLLDYCWLVPLPEVANRIHQISPELKTCIVGHTIFSGAPTVDITTIREQLRLQHDEPVLFFSGSKVANDDLELIQEIFSEMKKNMHHQVKMIVGLHPGMENISAYLNQLSDLITTNQLAGRVNYIVNDVILSRLGGSITHEHAAIRANVNGNDAAKVCTGVASVSPATLANQAYLDGLPVYIARDIDKAYLFSDYEENIESFLYKVSHQEKRTCHIEGVPHTSIGESIAQTGLR